MTGNTTYSSTTYIDNVNNVVIEDGKVYPIDKYFKEINPKKDFIKLMAKIAVDRSNRKNTENEI